MVVMAANTFFLLNSFSYHGITHNNLRATLGSIDAKKKEGTFCGLAVKNIAKVNATRYGATKTTFLKPNMMLEQNENDLYKVTDLGLGILKDGSVFQQNFRIRSYEVGLDRTLSIETIMNLLQETSNNYMKASEVWSDRLGLTREMRKKNLIWVMAKLQLAVDHYPICDDIIQIDTWTGAYRKIGVCSNWTFCDNKTGEILLRASCVWLLMNEDTRRLSKFPAEVRHKVEALFRDTTPPTAKKLSTRDESVVEYVRYGLTPRWSDIDVNQHVNNAKYAGWILESVPYSILEKYELASMTLEYCRECTKENVLESRTYVMGTDNGKLDGYDQVDCEHMLQLEIEGGVIMKGWTTWRAKSGNGSGLD
ncbi:palmitoyl-acyl carrier protein thioesterase, chloroplastic-like [Bidens hawaiensis]|uniref:palmitoyl-acyl carrier protein thioesterase, chloroplastic-like n=1 Tax=Bidens hawaiensis TaxID=980011 RepID=UPI00404A95A4